MAGLTQMTQMTQAIPQSTCEGLFSEWKSKKVGSAREPSVSSVSVPFLAKKEGLTQTRLPEPTADAVVPSIPEPETPQLGTKRERWSLADELACTARCKRCRGPIQWGELEQVFDGNHPDGRPPDKRDRKWIPLDPDHHPHACGVTRLLEAASAFSRMALTVGAAGEVPSTIRHDASYAATRHGDA